MVLSICRTDSEFRIQILYTQIRRMYTLTVQTYTSVPPQARLISLIPKYKIHNRRSSPLVGYPYRWMVESLRALLAKYKAHLCCLTLSRPTLSKSILAQRFPMYHGFFYAAAPTPPSGHRQPSFLYARPLSSSFFLFYLLFFVN